MEIEEKSKISFLYDDPGATQFLFDSFTAATNGDLSYFTKFDVGMTGHFSTANKSGWTPIMYACSRGHALVVSYMIMCGVKTNCTTKSKVTPLMLAISSGDLSTVECIFNHADLECKDYKLWTPLFYAIYFLHEKCVEFLLSKGANVNVTDFQNETPLILAIKSGSETIVDLVLSEAKNLEVVSYNNESALMIAKTCGNKRIQERVFQRHWDLKMAKEQREPTEKFTSLKKLTISNKENLLCMTPSPKKKGHKNRSFLGLKLNRSLSYSPNKNCNNKSTSLYNTPNRSSDDKTPLWKMCVTKTPVPTVAHYDVEILLNSLGLEKYWPIFRDEEVDFETLLTFTEQNLKEIGITLFGPRKKILFAIQQLRLCVEE